MKGFYQMRKYNTNSSIRTLMAATLIDNRAFLAGSIKMGDDHTVVVKSLSGYEIERVIRCNSAPSIDLQQVIEGGIEQLVDATAMTAIALNLVVAQARNAGIKLPCDAQQFRSYLNAAITKIFGDNATMTVVDVLTVIADKKYNVFGQGPWTKWQVNPIRMIASILALAYGVKWVKNAFQGNTTGGKPQYVLGVYIYKTSEIKASAGLPSETVPFLTPVAVNVFSCTKQAQGGELHFYGMMPNEPMLNSTSKELPPIIVVNPTSTVSRQIADLLVSGKANLNTFFKNVDGNGFLTFTDELLAQSRGYPKRFTAILAAAVSATNGNVEYAKEILTVFGRMNASLTAFLALTARDTRGWIGTTPAHGKVAQQQTTTAPSHGFEVSIDDVFAGSSAAQGNSNGKATPATPTLAHAGH